jgi:hypothetical protein
VPWCAGVPGRVARLLAGHRTRALFERDNIVNSGDLCDAARRWPHRVGGHPLTRNGRFCPEVGGHPPRKWPVLVLIRCVGGARARQSRRPSNSRRWSRDGPRAPARCAAATSRADRARGFAAVWCRPRRCSCRRQNLRSVPTSTSRSLLGMAGFQLSINGRFCVSTEVEEFLNKINRVVRDIPAPSVNLPAWNQVEDEGAYNARSFGPQLVVVNNHRTCRWLTRSHPQGADSCAFGPGLVEDCWPISL